MLTSFALLPPQDEEEDRKRIAKCREQDRKRLPPVEGYEPAAQAESKEDDGPRGPIDGTRGGRRKRQQQQRGTKKKQSRGGW